MSVLDNFKFAGSIPSKPSFMERLRGVETGAETVHKEYGGYQTTRSARPGIPSFDYSPSYTNRLWLSWCYWYEDETSILCDVLQKMRDEIVRYGFVWKPTFAKKCEICGQEYKEVVQKCEVCGSENLSKPDKAQQRLARIDEHYDFVEKANINEQTLQDVMKQALFHTLVTDNGYILAHKEYHWNDKGEIISSFPREFMALDPRDVIKLFDFETGYPGKGRVCLEHRSTLLGEKDHECPTCHRKTYRAFYQVFTATKTSTYYIKDEICHLIFYYPSLIYGYPKCLKIKDILVAYHMIDKRVRNYYEYCKVPGILFIPTDNPEGIQEMWKKTREETADDPYTPAVLGVSEIAPTNANFIKLMEDPNQNLISVKEDLRDRIASAYGVTMAFTNDTSQTGGLKNDKNLISLSDRTIRSFQKFLDTKVFKWMTLSMGITDWRLECEPNINDNKMEEEEVIGAKLQNMQMFTQLGIPVEWKDKDYIVSELPDEATGGVGTAAQNPEMMAPGGAGGMPGMPPGGGGMPMPGGEGGDEEIPMPAPAPEPEPEAPTMMDVNSGDFFANAALGRPIPQNAPKKRVHSELSKILEELFYQDEVAQEKKEEAEAAKQEQQQSMMQMGGMGGGMPPGGDMGGGEGGE